MADAQEEPKAQQPSRVEAERSKSKRKRTESCSSDDEWTGRTINDISVRERIGKGSFGVCYRGVKDKTKEVFCLKIEDREINSKLVSEYEALRQVEKKAKQSKQSFLHVPCAFCVLEHEKFNILVQSLLGPSLEEIFQRCDQKIDEYSVLLLAPMVIDAIEQVHRSGLIHRDIKPHNFLLGRGPDAHKVFLVDFGLSRAFKKKEGEHKPFRLGKHMVGTVRYVSLNVHRGYESSRRDDMEAIGYMFLYMINGRLPWQGLGSRKDKVKRNKLVHHRKEETRLASLCQGSSMAFQQYLKYSKGLEYQERPDYKNLRGLFTTEFREAFGTPDYSQYLWCKRGLYDGGYASSTEGSQLDSVASPELAGEVTPVKAQDPSPTRASPTKSERTASVL
ncbi:Casein kinase I isoform alpha [Diplonema papillatum]|nr:Casein kinase I isoform alpha [Diplonema papillatum]|eukprot:gene21398-32906_t